MALQDAFKASGIGGDFGFIQLERTAECREGGASVEQPKAGAAESVKFTWTPSSGLLQGSVPKRKSLSVDTHVAQIWLRKAAEADRRLRVLESGGPLFLQ